MDKKYKIKSKVWLYSGQTAWHFVGIPKKESEEIKKKCKIKIGFGSVPVMVTLGKTKWKTSIFPDKRSGTYLLPIKAEVRKKENIMSEDTVSLTIQI
ncbi:DUF1905 domain-containing protein [Candidatus Gracilibacteria bacterium]|nr:DUF1905 domain-containing protein [Candidatus Gracilibacteria bacterium]